MEFIKSEDNILTAKINKHTLRFQLYDKVVEVKHRYYMIGTPLDNFELYPSGEDSVIIFRYDRDNDLITGMEDDFEVSAEVMNAFQDSY